MGRYVMGFISPWRQYEIGVLRKNSLDEKLNENALDHENALDLRAKEAARVGAAQGQAGAFVIYTKETHNERRQSVSVSDPDTPALRLILSLCCRQLLLLGF